MATTKMDVETLRSGFTGHVLEPGQAGYDQARTIHNAMIDRHPSLITTCMNTADVVDAVLMATRAGLEISVKGGGHNVAGRAVTDGGLMIDLSAMKGIRVDPRTRTAIAQPGLTWREFNRATHVYGLAVTGGVISSTGIAGLTLGGGLGWTMSSFGMAVDNLLSVELVTTKGEVLQIDANREPDLFWAVRGGGGNFGVVTSLEYRLHPLATVTGGLIAHPFVDAMEVLDLYRDATSNVSDELTIFAGLVHAPDGSGTKMAALLVCHVGSPARADADLARLTGFGKPLMVDVKRMPYPAVNTLLDDAFPKGARTYWKSGFVSSLTDESFKILVDNFSSCPSPMSGIVLEHFHGAVTRVDPTATAFPHRSVGHNLLISGQWAAPQNTDENIAWVQGAYESIRPHLSGGRYVNYLDGDDDDAIEAAYGPNFDRLLRVKRRHDPDNVFHLNQNIDPNR
jgi:FAD/FMN-containing dehydrogenase